MTRANSPAYIPEPDELPCYEDHIAIGSASEDQVAYEIDYYIAEACGFPDDDDFIDATEAMASKLAPIFLRYMDRLHDCARADLAEMIRTNGI